MVLLGAANGFELFFCTSFSSRFNGIWKKLLFLMEVIILVDSEQIIKGIVSTEAVNDNTKIRLSGVIDQLMIGDKIYV